MSIIKHQLLYDLAERENIDILGISETGISDKNMKLHAINNNKYNIYYHNIGENKDSGVAIIIKKELSKNISKIEKYKGRIIYIDLFFRKKRNLR
ncbi:hypothetical protein RclHR1_25220002 [Rhizophagus clarus]|uniref:Uncharacterized protein n=1 Tax=Rhizophagus clarus TaxID=94130 RepID=A0A2Z6RTV3_9GLOM|nr:hypothetical protein RclHR1_25220002 [Rhizophagus clarus]